MILPRFLLEPLSLYFRSLDLSCSEQLPGNIESCPGEGARPLDFNVFMDILGCRGASQGCPGLSTA